MLIMMKDRMKNNPVKKIQMSTIPKIFQRMKIISLKTKMKKTLRNRKPNHFAF
jgi:hypothetical protein